MEHEIYVSGIGGQGVQLIAKMLALAAIAEDRHAMLNGFYGSEMRGGVSLSTVVIGNMKLKALPVCARVGAAVVLHHQYWPGQSGRLRDGGLVVADAAVADHLAPMPRQALVRVPATRIATALGQPMAAGMVLMSAFNAVAGLVAVGSLLEAMAGLVPGHRRQHVEANQAAILAGNAAVAAGSHRLRLDPCELAA